MISVNKEDTLPNNMKQTEESEYCLNLLRTEPKIKWTHRNQREEWRLPETESTQCWEISLKGSEVLVWCDDAVLSLLTAVNSIIS